MPPAVRTMQRPEIRDGKSAEGGALAAAARMADQAGRAIGTRSRSADGRIHRAAERLIPMFRLPCGYVPIAFEARASRTG